MKKIILFMLVAISFVQATNASDDAVMCTMDAKQCSDWSYVWRTWPNCEFVCPWDKKEDTKKACTREYAPVCGEVKVQCFTTPCDPVQETFSNKCEMENNSLATFLHSWACEADSWTTQIANPASAYCEENWWKISIAEKADWSQYWICTFDDWRLCEEWSLYRWDCAVWWRKITWYIWEYAKYCAITWNEFVNKWQDKNGDDIWDCKLKSWEVVDAKTFYWTSPDANEYTQVEDVKEETFACPMIYAPVCWVDGKTYWNACSAQKVWVKYNWTCVWEKLETKVYDAWKKAVNAKLSNASLENISSKLEKVISRAETLASKESFESVKAWVFNYIKVLAQNSLHENIYEKYIKNNISTITTLKPTLWGKWYVTKITWVDTNTAKVEYEDGHVVEKIKVQIKVESGKLKVTNLEKALEMSTKFDNKNFNIKLKVPTSWEWKYEYKFLNDWVLSFSFVSDGEWNNMLFSLNLNTAESWKKLETEWLLNNTKLLNVWDYVVSYSNVLDMPFTKDKNIEKYSTMIWDVNDVLDSVDISIK